MTALETIDRLALSSVTGAADKEAHDPWSLTGRLIGCWPTTQTWDQYGRCVLTGQPPKAPKTPAPK
jgi:hypothetical protein